MGNRDGKGWWFCGRHAALTDITTWLSRPDPARPLLAVTGDPGSGKTAVLGLIASLAHPEYWRTVPTRTLDLPPEAIPAPGLVDVAIYAQNLTVDQVRDGIAAAAHLAVNTVGELALALREREVVLTVLIDGLDEAADPARLTRELLRPLLTHAGNGIRLLVGTRPYLLEGLGLDRERALDLDAPCYADLAALTTYTVRGLLEAEPDSIYLTSGSRTIRSVAIAVAEQANPSFLVARIVAATLSADSHLPDPNDPAWRAGLPALPSQAMHHDLETRLRGNADKARELLRPLAFAQGQGLPWEDLWAPIASAVAGTTYTDLDLMWLRHTAGSYVVEATEANRSAYRLYHQALAEYLARDHDPTTVHTHFVHVLRQRVPLGADGKPNWARAHPYTLRHLATHAARAGLIDDLITDMNYLVHAEPDPLLAALVHITTSEATLTRAIYRCSAARHRHLPPDRRRHVLAIDAARFGAGVQQHQLENPLPWRIRWATGALTHIAHRSTLTGHTEPLMAVACTRLDGRPVAVTAGFDRVVRVWDLGTGTERAVLTVHTDQVWAVGCTEVDGRPVAVTAGSDRSVRVWDLGTGTERVVLVGHTDIVRALACTEVDGRPVAVTASYDRSVRVWDLATGTEWAVLTGHTGPLWNVACTEVDRRPVAITVGEDAVRVWDLATGAERAVLTDRIQAVACTKVDGRPVAITASEDETLRIWDLKTGRHRVLASDIGQIFALACTEVDWLPVAVTGGHDRTVRVWDLSTGTERAVLTGHTDWVQAVACTEVDGRPVAVTAGHDCMTRVWDLNTARHSTRTGHTDRIRTVACTEVDGRPVAVTAGHDRVVRVWDLDTGTERSIPTGHTIFLVQEVACTEVDGRPVAVTASGEDAAQVWDLGTGTERAVLASHAEWVWSVACTELNGRPVAVTTSEDAVEVWDLGTGTELVVLAGHTGPVRAVACTEVDGRPVAVTAGHDHTVRVWDLGTGTERVVLYTGQVLAVACTEVDGRPVAVTVGEDAVRIWDLGAGAERAVLAAHTGQVGAVACTKVDGRPVAITVGEDAVRVWDLTSLVSIAVIDYSVRALAVASSGGAIIVVIDNDIAVLDFAANLFN
ncbi:WD40 repeat domain-containing protein [Nocardia sp. NPDC005825]|uniref:WD40 repeat domain-containing protein n=1 Tax=unclassified Nocardia TaxID=2637762 RepID=UPI0033F7364F